MITHAIRRDDFKILEGGDMVVSFKNDRQKKVVEAMGKAQIDQGATLSDTIMWKVLGVSCPFWVCDYPNGKQKRYAINELGYDCFLPIN